jgi:hypothetical protein
MYPWKTPGQSTINQQIAVSLENKQPGASICNRDEVELNTEFVGGRVGEGVGCISSLLDLKSGMNYYGFEYSDPIESL